MELVVIGIILLLAVAVGYGLYRISRKGYCIPDAVSAELDNLIGADYFPSVDSELIPTTPSPLYAIGSTMQIVRTSAADLIAIGMDANIAELHENATAHMNGYPVEIVEEGRPSDRFNGYEYQTTDGNFDENFQPVLMLWPEICIEPLVLTQAELNELNGDTYEQHADELKEVVSELLNTQSKE